jgi:capsular polysaccharide biosynthesis protein
MTVIGSFTGVTLETMTWKQQISLFHDAEIIVGQAGSGLHNSLFSGAETRLASIGFMNPVQSEIGALRGHHNAFLTNGINLRGEFMVNEQVFRTFLNQVCA